MAKKRLDKAPTEEPVSRRDFLKYTGGAVAGGAISAGISAAIHNNMKELPLDQRIEMAVEQITPNCCTIEGETECGFCPEKHKSIGSGAVINTDSGQYLLTCFHVVEGKHKENTSGDAVYDVRMFGSQEAFKAAPCLLKDGSRAYSEHATGDDIALLEIPPNTLQVPGLNLRKTPVRPAEQLIVIGSPLGMENNATTGIASSPARESPNSPNLQFTTSAIIDQGNSGSAVCDLNKELTGIVSWMAGRGISAGTRSEVIREHLQKWGIEKPDPEPQKAHRPNEPLPLH